MHKDTLFDAKEIAFATASDVTLDAEEPSVPSMKTLMNILESLIMCGKLKRTDLHRRSSISYVKLIEYIEWLKYKNFVAECNSYIVISDKGRMLYNLLA
ncbi:MAG: hypothetical protein QXU32_13115 [Nitrososphaerales archaeon]